VYKNQGKRVYYPFDPPPYLDGVRINSPHYLTKAGCSQKIALPAFWNSFLKIFFSFKNILVTPAWQMVLPPGENTRKFTVVVSQVGLIYFPQTKYIVFQGP
jgi:hypothetical protein